MPAEVLRQVPDNLHQQHAVVPVVPARDFAHPIPEASTFLGADPMLPRKIWKPRNSTSLIGATWLLPRFTGRYSAKQLNRCQRWLLSDKLERG